ncbi:MAG: hypothetical protein HOY78_29740 [Saccharothrix sp.]|nr:hypothetical protein [Saccharothrix sp.]
MSIEPDLPPWWMRDFDAPRLVEVVDAMMAPILQVLDRVDDHLDPRTAPRHVVDWLASVFGIDAGRRQREVLTALASIYDGWSTTRGLTELITAFLGDDGTVEIRDSGATSWSPTPGTPLPGDGTFELHVLISLAETADLDTYQLEALVAHAVPAHVRHIVHIRRADE